LIVPLSWIMRYWLEHQITLSIGETIEGQEHVSIISQQETTCNAKNISV